MSRSDEPVHKMDTKENHRQESEAVILWSSNQSGLLLFQCNLRGFNAK